MIKTRIIGISLAVLLAVLFSLIPGRPVYADTKFEYYDTGDTGGATVYGINWKAQTFTPATAYTITYVRLKLYRVGVMTGSLTVGIRSSLTGGDLTSGSILNSSITTSTAGAWYQIDLTSYALAPGVSYGIVIRAITGDATKYIVWRVDITGDYAGGYRNDSTNSGGSWSTVEAHDFMFETWGNATSVPPGVTSFTLTKISANQTNAAWVKSAGAIGVDLVRSYLAYPVSPTDYYLIYHGTANSYEDKGLFPFSDKYYAIWEYNFAGSSSGYSRGKIEGDIMDVNFTLDTNTIIMAFAFALLAASVFLRHLLIYLALCIAWLTVIFYPGTNFPGYIHLASLAVVFYGVFSIFKLKENSGG
jgi:hypothetical protein